ncbi:MAG: hypothetical protein ICV68_00265 [Pyrinomonadaceae bacterium]|nr:hypothetical protein [Pyrinomonadaceae bacterium]
MAFSRIFDGKATLEELERALENMQKLKMANLLTVQGRNAQLDDGTKMNVNVAQFDPQDRRSQVHDDIKMVKKEDASVAFRAQMAAEGRAPVGGDMNVFVENKTVTILVFGKTT